MANLSHRNDRTERMDDPDFPPVDYDRCLADLERVNRLTLTHRPTLTWLDRVTANLPPGAKVSILDVGYGHGDLLRAMAAWSARRRLDARLEGIDLNPRAAARAATHGGLIAYRTGDVFAFTPDPSPDFIVSSQFTHHLADPDLVRFIRWMEANSTKGWFVSDLHRTAYAYYGFRILCRVAGWHRIVREDGTASIARSFRRADWQRLLDEARIDARIEPHLASRLCVARLK
jgi:2-polyprenyl-3-methyl-5-hydroxy-6-metoxy-1,4-benzoquinol methylase